MNKKTYVLYDYDAMRDWADPEDVKQCINAMSELGCTVGLYIGIGENEDMTVADEKKKWVLDNYEYDFKTVVVGKGVEKDIMCKLYRDEQGPDARVMLVTGGGRRC